MLPVYVNSNIIHDYKKDIKLMSSLEMASVGLSHWKSEIAGIHIYRDEVESILNWVDGDLERQEDRVAVVIGNAGTGKSVIMEDVYNSLIEKYPVLGIKLDQINFHSTHELNQEVGLDDGGSIVNAFQKLNENYKRSVLLIDQIDALSMSLSNDRSAMNVANQLVEQISSLPNVRVVISCRRFDIDYDYTLREYKRYKTIYIHELPEEEVNRILAKIGVNPQSISERVKEFLSVPINLYLFSIVANQNLYKSDEITLQQLYDELWKKIILHSKDSRQLNECLSKIVEKMYVEQSLTIDSKVFADSYDQQISYLLSEGFMVGHENGGIQFLHQSLFDYTYARKFYDSGRSIIEELKGEHQGLFVRSRLRQVLLYLREVSTRTYLDTLDKILFEKKYNGVPVIRFHLKMLALNTIGYCENVSDIEKQYFLDKVICDDKFGPIFVDSAYSKDWFKTITTDSIYKDKVQQEEKSAIQLMMSLCYKNFTLNENMVDNYLEQLSNLSSPNIKVAVYNLICKIGRYANDRKPILNIFKKVKPLNSLPKAAEFLKNVIDIDSELVEDELLKDIKVLSEEVKNDALKRLQFDYETEEVFEELKKKHQQHAYKLCIDAIHLVFDKTKFKYNDGCLTSSWSFYSYKRNEAYANDTIFEMIDYILDSVEKDAKKCPKNFTEQLDTYIHSDRDIDVLIALVGYAANPVFFKTEVMNILTNSDWLEKAIEHSSNIDYYSKRLFKFSFMTFDKSGQEKILISLSNTHPKWETSLFKYHERYAYPLTKKGKSFGQFIEFLDTKDKDYISNEFPCMYQKYEAIKDKYIYLKTNEPNRMEVHSGWVGVKESAYDNMTDEQWLQLMRKYKDDSFDAEFEKPTMTGISMQFKTKVQADPNRFINVILEANKDSEIKFGYVLSGFDGLTASDKEVSTESVHKVFSAITKRIEGDINEFGSGNLCSILRSLTFFLKRKEMPEDVFCFICRAVVDIKEDDDANDEKNLHPYDTGINRARGIAGRLLVQCSILGEKYCEGIFRTLESVAMNASIVTRAAILLEMARLNNLDTDRSLSLYLLLLHDYQTSLLAMPLHNLNPLVYYINYGFDRLIPLFKEAIKRPQCHEAITTILWIAYIRNYKYAEDLFSQIICASSTASISFFHAVTSNIKTIALSESMKYLLEMLTSEDKEVCKRADMIFDGFQSWSDEELETLTNAYVTSDCSIYASNGFYKCLNSYLNKKPVRVLGWIIAVYEKKKKNGDNQNEVFDLQHIMQILTMSYNGVRKYNPEDNFVENAMNVMDEILADSQKRSYLSGFLTELDKR